MELKMNNFNRRKMYWYTKVVLVKVPRLKSIAMHSEKTQYRQAGTLLFQRDYWTHLSYSIFWLFLCFKYPSFPPPPINTHVFSSFLSIVTVWTDSWLCLLCLLAWRQPLQQHVLLKFPNGMDDANEQRKVNKMQLFGFMLEKQRTINNVFREKSSFPDSKRKASLSYL